MAKQADALTAAWEKVRAQIPQYADAPLTPDGLLHGVRQLAAIADGERILRQRSQEKLAAMCDALRRIAKYEYRADRRHRSMVAVDEMETLKRVARAALALADKAKGGR